MSSSVSEPPPSNGSKKSGASGSGNSASCLLLSFPAALSLLRRRLALPRRLWDEAVADLQFLAFAAAKAAADADARLFPVGGADLGVAVIVVADGALRLLFLCRVLPSDGGGDKKFNAPGELCCCDDNVETIDVACEQAAGDEEAIFPSSPNIFLLCLDIDGVFGAESTMKLFLRCLPEIDGDDTCHA